MLTTDHTGQLVKFIKDGKKFVGILFDIDSKDIATIGTVHTDKLSKVKGSFGTGSITIHKSKVSLVF
jgi:hypothetical protein